MGAGGTGRRRIAAIGAALVLGAGAASGVALSQGGDGGPPRTATVPPPTVTVPGPNGEVEIADPEVHVDVSEMAVIAEGDGQVVLRGPGADPANECLLVAPAEPPADMSMLGCDPRGVFDSKGTFLAAVGADGSIGGAVLLPDGATDVRVNGAPVPLRNGVATFRRIEDSVTITATTPSGPFEERLVARGDYHSTPGVRPDGDVPVLE